MKKIKNNKNKNMMSAIHVMNQSCPSNPETQILWPCQTCPSMIDPCDVRMGLKQVKLGWVEVIINLLTFYFRYSSPYTTTTSNPESQICMVVAHED